MATSSTIMNGWTYQILGALHDNLITEKAETVDLTKICRYLDWKNLHRTENFVWNSVQRLIDAGLAHEASITEQLYGLTIKGKTLAQSLSEVAFLYTDWFRDSDHYQSEVILAALRTADSWVSVKGISDLCGLSETTIRSMIGAMESVVSRKATGDRGSSVKEYRLESKVKKELTMDLVEDLIQNLQEVTPDPVEDLGIAIDALPGLWETPASEKVVQEVLETLKTKTVSIDMSERLHSALEALAFLQECSVESLILGFLTFNVNRISGEVGSQVGRYTSAR
jgi:predicted transcriptional regulator